MAPRVRDQFDLGGKVAVVTGASRGIGAAIARGLAEFGARVVLSSRKQDAVDAAAQALRDDGLEATGVAAHVGDPEAVRRLVERTRERYGGVDVLVNNAATNPVSGPLLETDGRAFDKVIEVNLKGPLDLARRVHPLMKERGGGSVINVSSVGALRPIAGLGLYNLSKAALINLTQVMAQEWAGDGIRANAICPGLVQTKLSEALWKNEEVLERFLQRVPLGRIARPDEMAALAVYLGSPASSYCTGAVFTADGGYTI
jgi:NAD(P)-dependent dehydrogenase (short-subunit alcohol dehydrogenase family)